MRDGARPPEVREQGSAREQGSTSRSAACVCRPITLEDVLATRASIAALTQPGNDDGQDTFRIDFDEEQLWHGMLEVFLPPKVFSLLRLFVENPSRLLRKEFILNSIWPNTCITEGMIKEYVRDLRKVLADDAKSPRFIETVHRRGYRFIGEVRTISGYPLALSVASRPWTAELDNGQEFDSRRRHADGRILP
ncbi:MAG: winged helix-turn-helix transcriptional regulator [Rhodospirillales bacterium]|nr:winged helix-turn-helix transcriptional regulator [Rhodospirillales bacterium]